MTAPRVSRADRRHVRPDELAKRIRLEVNRRSSLKILTQGFASRIRVGAGEQGDVMSPRLPRAPQTFEQLVLDFLADLELKRGLARNTVDAYRGDLVQLGAFLAHRGRDALAVKPAELAAFVEELANSRAGKTPLAATTLQRKGRLPALVLPSPAARRNDRAQPGERAERLARRRPQSLSRQDIQQLLAQPGGTSCYATAIFARSPALSHDRLGAASVRRGFAVTGRRYAAAVVTCAFRLRTGKVKSRCWCSSTRFRRRKRWRAASRCCLLMPASPGSRTFSIWIHP